MTVYTGEAFRPIFEKAMGDWWHGGCNGVKPRNNWQLKNIHTDVWCDTYGECPTFDGNHIYRFKPAPKLTQWVGYRDRATKQEHWKELVAPETVAPELHSFYYVVTHETTGNWVWLNDDIDKNNLAEGKIFLTREDAQAMADWTAECRRGGAK